MSVFVFLSGEVDRNTSYWISSVWHFGWDENNKPDEFRTRRKRKKSGPKKFYKNVAAEMKLISGIMQEFEIK